MSTQSTQEAVAEIWKLFRETGEQFREERKQFQEMREQSRETDNRLAQMRMELKEETRERDERLDRRFRETDAALRRLEGMFGIQWGRMMEALVHPSALQLFREWGIDVHESYRRLESRVNGHRMELDIVLENANDAVIIEVKSLVKVQDVDDLVTDLQTLLTYFARFAGRRVFGGIAGLEFAEGADIYAFRQGLFVLALSGEGIVSIKNGSNFRPKDFGH
ncbi:MAG: hypothetical protein HY328_03650 [Chloroflexi bacterium]|nr:hypothetical protein [Chloroflexota bacterium]